MKIGKDYIGVGVGAFILNENNELLLQKRAVPAEKDHWCIPDGRLEMFETLEHAVSREVKEETVLTLNSYKLRCIVTYISTTWETEYMYVFTSNDFTGELIECNEGDLQ